MNAIFVGEKRSGKTTLALETALRQDGGIIVFDPKKEFRNWPATVSNREELERQIKHERVIIWRPTLDRSIEESWDELADWILEKHALALKKHWDMEGYHFTVLIDEAYNLQSHNRINEKLLRILSECRPEVLDVYQTFQSIKNVNSDSRSRVSDWFLFTITLPSDLKRLEEFAMPSIVEEVQKLGEHEYIHFENEKGRQNVEIVKDAATWYRPLDYEPEQEGEEMAREEKKGLEFPLQFDSEADWWDAVDKHNRRTGQAKDTMDRSRRSDRKSKEKSGGKGEGSEKKEYHVYKRD